MSYDFQKLAEDIAEIKADLKHHIRRTELAEESIQILRDEIKPIQRHAAQVEGVFKFLGVFSLVAGIAAAIVQILRG